MMLRVTAFITAWNLALCSGPAGAEPQLGYVSSPHGDARLFRGTHWRHNADPDEANYIAHLCDMAEAVGAESHDGPARRATFVQRARPGLVSHFESAIRGSGSTAEELLGNVSFFLEVGVPRGLPREYCDRRYGREGIEASGCTFDFISILPPINWRGVSRWIRRHGGDLAECRGLETLLEGADWSCEADDASCGREDDDLRVRPVTSVTYPGERAIERWPHRVTPLVGMALDTICGLAPPPGARAAQPGAAQLGLRTQLRYLVWLAALPYVETKQRDFWGALFDRPDGTDEWVLTRGSVTRAAAILGLPTGALCPARLARIDTFDWDIAPASSVRADLDWFCESYPLGLRSASEMQAFAASLPRYLLTTAATRTLRLITQSTAPWKARRMQLKNFAESHGVTGWTCPRLRAAPDLGRIFDARGLEAFTRAVPPQPDHDVGARALAIASYRVERDPERWLSRHCGTPPCALYPKAWVPEESAGEPRAILRLKPEPSGATYWDDEEPPVQRELQVDVLIGPCEGGRVCAFTEAAAWLAFPGAPHRGCLESIGRGYDELPLQVEVQEGREIWKGELDGGDGGSCEVRYYHNGASYLMVVARVGPSVVSGEARDMGEGDGWHRDVEETDEVIEDVFRAYLQYL